MHSDEKTTQADNLRDLEISRQQILNRTSGQMSCFESMLKLNSVCLSMCLAPELDETDLAGLGEVLSL